MRTVGILLAAGSGSRFGGDKLLAALPDGVAVGLQSLRNLRAAIADVIVVTRPEDAAAASESGATFIGAILSESPRRVTPARAAEIFAAAGAARSVSVFRHTDAPALVSDARASGAGIVQLHGRFDLDEISFIREEFEGEIWRVAPGAG